MRERVNEEKDGFAVRRWVRRPGTVWVAVGPDTMIAHPDLAERFRVEGVGGLLWERLGEPHGVAELVDLVLSLYDVTPDRAESDVVRCMESLFGQDLIVEAGAET